MLTQANAQGSSWVVNTMYHTPNTNGDTGVSGGYNWLTSNTPPLQFIPYTPDESNWNATNANHVVYGVFSISQFYSPGDGNQYITIEKTIEQNGGATSLGGGLAICPTNPITGSPSRVESRPGNAEPYLMWDESEGEWGDMCVTMSNYVYFYWVQGQNYGGLCVARASLLGSPPAFLAVTNWTYWDGTTWVTNNPSVAAILFYDAGDGTIDWNAFLTNGSGGRGCYLFTYLFWVSTEIYTRASSDLVHWSAPTLQYTIPFDYPIGDFPYNARAQKCLEKNNGQTVYISWSMPCTNIPDQNIEMLKAQFPLANPAFSGLTASQSISYGASNITLRGTVSANGAYPACGEPIIVTINGNAQSTAVNDSTGDFSINYNPSTLPASGSPYTIAYSYAGDGWLNPTANASTTLTVISTPLIQTVMQAGSSFTFSWSTLTNQTYRIQATASLDPANWTDLGGTITATNSTMTISEGISTNSQQFYRVVLLP
jgi:hypothetical protein